MTRAAKPAPMTRGRRKKGDGPDLRKAILDELERRKAAKRTAA